ncbi:MAG TPA: carbamate kinase [Longimicrobiales bacterium]|nr:carbamate kinase [Longimicrobiales bacterium]
MGGLLGGAAEAPCIVVALGGNALSGPGEAGDITSQFAHTRQSLAPIVALAREGWRIAVVHGNGPQIGDELLRHELAHAQRPMFPIGVLVASTAGWIGYMIQQSLQNALRLAGVRRHTVTLITQVIVDAPPTGMEPVKPIGRSLSRDEALRLRDALGWTVGERDGKWRRLAPSPVPRGIVERDEIRRLVDEGVIVIAAGGGGTPAYREADGTFEGVDAVVDKDRAAQVLAHEIGATVLLIVTNVEGVYSGYGTPAEQLVRELDVARARAMLQNGELGSGSMAPKVEAAIAFVGGGKGRRAHIAALEKGLDAVNGRAGTVIIE